MKKLYYFFLLLPVFQSNAQTWSLVSTGSSAATRGFNDVAFADANTGWVIGNSGSNTGDFGLILKTTNAGASSFTPQNTGYYNNNKQLSVVDANTVWMATSSIILFKTINGGTSWTIVQPGPSPTYPYNLLNDVFFKDANNGWTVGDNGTIYKTSDGGINWTKQTSGTTYNLKTVFFATTTIGWAGGDNTTMLKTTDGGDHWTSVAITFPPYIFGGNPITDLYFINSTTGWATINALAIIKTTDGGSSWTTYPANSSTVLSVCFTDANNGWAVGQFGYVGKSTDGGLTWTQQSGFDSSPFYNKIFFTDSNHGWICGSSGFLYKYTNSGCPSTLSPTGTITTNQKAATTVITVTGTSQAGTQNIIPNSANVIYQAGSYVTLNPGFVANKSSVFSAIILAGCQ